MREIVYFKVTDVFKNMFLYTTVNGKGQGSTTQNKVMQHDPKGSYAMIQKERVIQEISKHKVIAIARGIYGEKCIQLAQALYEGGIKLLEITFDQSNFQSLQETADTLQSLNRVLGDKMLLGAGTVISAQEVDIAAKAGARFIVSPNTDEAVIAETLKQGLVSIPGAMTPSEILNANRLGADFVKLFPSAQLGYDYIKSIRAPINHIMLLATGGVNIDNISAFLKLGMAGAGVGGSLCSKTLVNEGRFSEITAAAEKYVAALESNE